MELMTEEKKEFKKSDIGLVPQDWEITTMDDICWVNQGLQIPIEKRLKSPTSKSKKYITIQFLGDRKEVEYIKDFSKSVTCVKDDILMTRTGNTGIVVTNVEGVFHNNFFKINYDKHKVYKEYLVYYLSDNKTQKRILEKAGTSTIPDLNHSDFYSLLIPLPTPKEQQTIASALSDVDELIRSLERLIEKKEAIKKGTMQQLLTGNKRLPGFDGEWEVKSLGEIGITINGLSGKRKADFGDGNHPYITFMNVMSNTVIDTSIFDTVKVRRGESQSEIKKGDLLFNTSSETPEEVGMCSVLLEDVENLHLNSFCFGYRIHEQDEVLPLFLAYYFRSEFGREHMKALAQGSTRYNLSKSKFVKIEIELPTYEEQKAIAQILSDMDRELQTLRQKRDKMRRVKEGMMQELLTGKTRLVK